MGLLEDLHYLSIAFTWALPLLEHYLLGHVDLVFTWAWLTWACWPCIYLSLIYIITAWKLVCILYVWSQAPSVVKESKEEDAQSETDIEDQDLAHSLIDLFGTVVKGEGVAEQEPAEPQDLDAEQEPAELQDLDALYPPPEDELQEPDEPEQGPEKVKSEHGDEMEEEDEESEKEESEEREETPEPKVEERTKEKKRSHEKKKSREKSRGKSREKSRGKSREKKKRRRSPSRKRPRSRRSRRRYRSRSDSRSHLALSFQRVLVSFFF